MAGDFVMVQCATPRKPEVLRIAELLKISRTHAFGLCIEAWIWFDEQTENGHAFGVTEKMFDAILCHTGFALALADVGWLSISDDGICVPNFDSHMGQSAKKRAKANKRQHKRRHAPVTLLKRKKCDKSVTKEEKRIEENRRDKEETPLPPLLQTDEFISAWQAWRSHRDELRKPVRPTMAAEQLAMLAGLGERRAVAMIRHTIAMGWQGLREPEQSGNGKQRPKCVDGIPEGT